MIVQIDTVYRYNIMSSKLQQTFLTILSSCFFSVGCITCFLQQMAPYHCLLILMAFHSCHVSVCTPACVWNASHKVCKRLVISGLVPFSSFESFLSFSFSCHPFRLGSCPDLTLLNLAHLASKTHTDEYTTHFRAQALNTNTHSHTHTHTHTSFKF